MESNERAQKWTLYIRTWSNAVTIKLRKSNGELASSDAENAEVFVEHFSKVLNIESEFDDSILALIKQRRIRDELADIPEKDEVVKAIKKMKNNKAAGDSVPIEYYKALLAESPETFEFFMDIVRDFWKGETTPEDWNFLRLKVLPKKGDLSKS